VIEGIVVAIGESIVVVVRPLARFEVKKIDVGHGLLPAKPNSIWG
jgi:hypothetical protein